MARRATRARRSRVEWGIRGLLALIAVIGGYVGTTHSLAYVLNKRDPARAYAIAPGDGRITGQYAQEIAGAPDATSQDRRRADLLAIRALRQDPTAVAAASALALDRQIAGDVAGARRLFGYAQRLSRRDLQSQVWAIEDAVTRGDVAGALTHYDIALRTSRNAPDLLFPILAAAIADPVVRKELVARLAATPSWSATFINYAAARGADPESTAQLLFALRRASIPLPAEAGAAVIDALIVGGFPDEAWDYYASIRPGSDRRRSRDPRFTVAPETPTVLDWMVANDDGISSAIQHGDSGGVLDFTAPPSVGGQLLRQLQVLPPGEYRLTGRSSGIDQPPSSRPYWSLICRNDGRELGRVEVLNSAQAGGMFGGGFTVPANCPVQTLVLVARPSGTMLGLSGQVVQAQLVPVS